jgi:hypothetical protein
VSQDEEKDEVVYDEDRQDYRNESLETESSVDGNDGDNGFDLDAVNARAICIEELTTDEGKEAENEDIFDGVVAERKVSMREVSRIRIDSAFSATGFLPTNSCSLVLLEAPSSLSWFSEFPKSPLLSYSAPVNDSPPLPLKQLELV